MCVDGTLSSSSHQGGICSEVTLGFGMVIQYQFSMLLPFEDIPLVILAFGPVLLSLFLVLNVTSIHLEIGVGICHTIEELGVGV